MSNNLKPDAAGDAAKRNRGSTTIVSFRRFILGHVGGIYIRVNTDMMDCSRDIKGCLAENHQTDQPRCLFVIRVSCFYVAVLVTT